MKVSVDQAPQSKGRCGECMWDAREWRCIGGRCYGREMVQGTYVFQSKMPVPARCILIVQVPANGVITSMIPFRASWECTSPLVSGPAAAHQMHLESRIPQT